MTPLRILYVCKAVDEDNPSTATQVRWIGALARNPRVAHVTVLCPYVGRASLPANVDIVPFGRRRWPWRAFPFVWTYLRLWRRPFDLYLVIQGGAYPALLFPFKVLRRVPLYQWKAHSHVSGRMTFYARYCDDLVFTATPGSLPLALPNVRVIGHGIDTELFQPAASDSATSAARDVVVVGRVAPAKHLDDVLRAVAACRTLGREVTVDIVGPADSKNRGTLDALTKLGADLGVDDLVRFTGPVPHTDMAARLPRYRLCVNFSDTALDKAAVEAMACGLPVITTNPRIAEALPADVRSRLVVPAGDKDAQARAILGVLDLRDAERAAMVSALRATALADHSLNVFFDKMLANVGSHGSLSARRSRGRGA